MLPTILVVDDDVAVLFAMKQFFSARGFHVDTTTHLMDARALVTASTYTVIIVDLHLTKANKAEGLEIIRYARARSRDTCILLVTADVSEAIRSEARLCGVDAVFSKPVSLRDVFDTVARLLGAGL